MAVSLFYWSPRRSIAHLAPEVRHNVVPWSSSLAHTGRLMTNFGDELSPLLMARLLQARVKWSKPQTASTVGIGSVLELVLGSGRSVDEPMSVLGSGLRAPFRAYPVPVGYRFLAVRGVHTRDALALPATTTLGDPGLLASEYLRRRDFAVRRSGVAIVPHFSDLARRDVRAWLRQQKAAGASIIYPSAGPEDAFRIIASVDLVVSSGLHGLVLANSAGIPCVVMSLLAERREGWDKYRDYLSVFGLDLNVASVRPSDVVSIKSELIDSMEEVTNSVRARIEGVTSALVRALSSVQVDSS